MNDFMSYPIVSWKTEAFHFITAQRAKEVGHMLQQQWTQTTVDQYTCSLFCAGEDLHGDGEGETERAPCHFLCSHTVCLLESGVRHPG